MKVTSAGPTVTVVMSCYNDEDCVERAITSIQAQTLTDWEFIIINDGSTDSTPKILDDLAEHDSRLRVIHQHNTGLTLALIRGCNEAKSPLIARQDADDRSHPQRLEFQSELLDRDSRLGFVSCHANYLGPEGEFLNCLARTADADEATQQLLEERVGPPAHGTVMFRKTVYVQVGGYRPQFYFAQDSDLWLRMAEMTNIGYVNKPLYDFYIHTASIGGSGRLIQAEFGKLGHMCREARLLGKDESSILQQASELKSRVLRERATAEDRKADRSSHYRIRKSQSDTNYIIGSQLVKNRDLRARRYLTLVIRQRPLHWRAWVRLAQTFWSFRLFRG